MSSETTLNVFKQELADAVKKAHGALDEVVTRFETYLDKLDAEVATPTAPSSNSVNQPTPDSQISNPTPTASPVAKPSTASTLDKTPDPTPGTGTSDSTQTPPVPSK